MEHSRDPMRDRALDHPEQETAEGKNTRKPPAFAVAAQPPPDDPGVPRDKDGKPARLPAQEHTSTPADATHAHIHGPTEVHPLVETQGVTITADNVAPADRKAWKYLGQEGISYYYFCEWKGVPYFITASSVNSGEDIYHYAEAKPDGEWKLFYPDMPPDFMGDLQATVRAYAPMLDWAQILVLETGMMLLCETVSLAGYAARASSAWWRAGRTVGRSAGKQAGKQAGKKVARKAAEQSAESAGTESAEQAGQKAVAAVAAKKMRPFTKANARHNLQVHTGEEGVGMDAHHVFPQAEKFSKFFDRTGINIHDPENLRWWPTASHKKAAAEYNLAWRNYMENMPNATRDEIIVFGKKLMAGYGF
jgi:Predicted lipoprotein of unknown function (DUF2380)